MKENLKNELRTLWSCFKAWLALRDAEREATRKAAGVITAWEYQQKKNELEAEQ